MMGMLYRGYNENLLSISACNCCGRGFMKGLYECIHGVVCHTPLVLSASVLLQPILNEVLCTLICVIFPWKTGQFTNAIALLLSPWRIELCQITPMSVARLANDNAFLHVSLTVMYSAFIIEMTVHP